MMATHTEKITLDHGAADGARQLAGLWFEEGLEIPQGRSMRVRIEKTLAHFRSQFQDIAVYETQSFGRMLTLDQTIQLTEYDEPHYHEMLAHVPLAVHPDPRRVLVIGGGDGGAVTEILKHRSVTEVHLCELDPGVVRAARKWFPEIASGLRNRKVKIFYEDGAKFINKRRNYYDVILVDSTDPVGPGQVLFQAPFYRAMHRALTRDGICVTQSESIMYHRALIKRLTDFQKTMYPVVNYYYTLVPTYPSGTIGFSFCSKRYHPVRDLDERRANSLRGLRYYSLAMHRAAFVLPRFAKTWFAE